MSLCQSCVGLAIWPKLFGGIRYLCDSQSPSPKEFGRYGYDTQKGFPKVQECGRYQHGLHYSRKGEKQ